MYLPIEWRNRTDTLIWANDDPQGQYTWSATRSRQTDNVIVLWDNGYGNKAPDQLPKNSPYYVDINDLLAKCEAFFDLELNTLGFVNPHTSNLARYKVMVLMNHTTDWACYGGGYDFQVPALWLSPNTCRPVGSAVAHEIGHSFHYMCYAEASNHGQKANIQTGFHSAIGKGAAIWEQTAQWQALQSYPGEMFTQSINVFRKSHNLAFTHEWHRYQSYWFFYYLTQTLSDIQAVANAWNYNTTTVIDFNQALMRHNNWKVQELYRRYYDYAAHCATFDFDAARPYRKPYIGDYEWRAIRTAEHTYQVAAASAPQATGFNIIPLQLPHSGTTITAQFTALPPNAHLADADPAEMLNGETQWAPINRNNYPSQARDSQKGFRLGFVTLTKNGQTQYHHTDTVYCQGTGEQTAHLQLTIPTNTQSLWMIVAPAPSAYNPHLWDDNPLTGDYIYPYRVTFQETDVDTATGKANIYASTDIQEAPVHDVTFDYQVRIATNNTYATQDVTLSPDVQAALAYAFQMQPSQIAAKLTTWSTDGPQKGKIMYCTANDDAIQPNTPGTNTNATYGHWFGTQGELKAWGNGAVVFCDFEPETLTFHVGYHPDNARTGHTYTITPALQYRHTDGTLATARFRLHVTTGGTATGTTELTQIIDPIADNIHSPLLPLGGGREGALYDLSGRRIANPKHAHGIRILNGKKHAVK